MKEKKFKETEGCGDYNFQSLSKKIINASKEKTVDAKIYGSVIPTKDAKEKIQNVQRRIKEGGSFDVKDDKGKILGKCYVISEFQLKKIFLSEIGGKLIKT